VRPKGDRHDGTRDRPTDERAAQIAAFETLGRRWVRRHDRVLVFNSPLSYLLVGSRIATNAVWLSAGPSDRYTVQFFDQHHSWPDKALVSRGLLQEAASTDPTLQDPLITVLKRDYRIVDLTAPLDVLVRS